MILIVGIAVVGCFASKLCCVWSALKITYYIRVLVVNFEGIERRKKSPNNNNSAEINLFMYS